MWEAALEDAKATIDGMNEDELTGAISDGSVSLRLVEILLDEMPGRRIPLQDRHSLTDKWRPVLIVGTEGDDELQLSLATGEIADESPDTPGGVLHLRDGNYSLSNEFGLFYRLPKELVSRVDASVVYSDDEEEEDTGGDGGGGGGGGGGGVDDEVIIQEDDAPGVPAIEDKMRLMWKQSMWTLRTREGARDTCIAATKARLVGEEPGKFELVLLADIDMALRSGEARVLSASDDQDSLMPADVLRGDKHVIGTLYDEIDSWPFAGAHLPCPLVMRTCHAHLSCALVMRTCHARMCLPATRVRARELGDLGSLDGWDGSLTKA